MSLSPEELAGRYYLEPAAAFVRAELTPERESQLWRLPLARLSAAQRAGLVARGLAAGLPLHRFKRTAGLPRVRRVLGLLRGLRPGELLDLGSGRGAFLWPLLDAFCELPVTAVERDPHPLARLQAVARGGLTRLSVVQAEAETLTPVADGAFDVACALEVLEHLPDPAPAARQLCRVARRYVVVSVPSRPDDNPGHLHLLDPGRLEAIFSAAGAAPPQLHYLHNHLIALFRLPRRAAP